MLTPEFIDCTLTPDGITDSTPGAAGHDLASGLLADSASIAPKYFYNTLGSKLFEAITLLDEYYPTRTEAGIMSTTAFILGPFEGQRLLEQSMQVEGCVWTDRQGTQTRGFDEYVIKQKSA